ncbi:MAG: YicC family protein [Clostridia bacterium]|nr:YicC family protein [Clostridia bacterium]
MTRSMTAFGRAKKEIGGKLITVEIKSVNNRYLDCSVHLPRLYSFLEEKVKSYLSQKGIARGKIDVGIAVEFISATGSSVGLDETYTRSYIAALKRLSEEFGLRDDISVMSVAQNRDIFLVSKQDEDAEKDWEEIRSVLDEAVEGFNAMRTAEGDRLSSDIRQKIAAIKAIASEIAADSEQEVAAYREKIYQRIRSMLGELNIPIDDSRILTECAIFADKVAIDEELVRLDSHFKAFEEIMSLKEPVGRKLDFLLQEINREANTIGSKVCDVRIARKVVDIKSEVEKIREQLQNIE